MSILVGILESIVFWSIFIIVAILFLSTIFFIVDGINYYLKFEPLSWLAFFGLIYLSIAHIYDMACNYPHRWDGWYGVLLIFGYYFVFKYFYNIGNKSFS
jgi:hypothetical protein